MTGGPAQRARRPPELGLSYLLAPSCQRGSVGRPHFCCFSCCPSHEGQCGKDMQKCGEASQANGMPAARAEAWRLAL